MPPTRTAVARRHAQARPACDGDEAPQTIWGEAVTDTGYQALRTSTR